MGYCYDMQGHLACDACGKTGGVRKRTCPHKVHYPEGGSLPYCYPSALCKDCYATHKATLHKDCKAGAEKSTARYAEIHARKVAGDFEVRSAFGSWHEKVPAGFVGVRFEGVNRAAEYRLVPADDYDPGQRRFLSEYPNAQPWTDPDLPVQKGNVVF